MLDSGEHFMIGSMSFRIPWKFVRNDRLPPDLCRGTDAPGTRNLRFLELADARPPETG